MTNERLFAIFLRGEKMNTKETIIERATDLFADKGYDGISVRTIARAVGITEGSMYNHFSSKRAILDEILDRHEKEVSSQIPSSELLIEAYDKPDWKPAWAYRIQVLEKAPESVDLRIMRILNGEQYMNEKASHIILTYYLDEPIKITYDLLKHLQDRGESLPGDPMTLAREYQYPIFTMTQEYVMKMSRNEDLAPVIEKMKDHVRFFWTQIMKKDVDF